MKVGIIGTGAYGLALALTSHENNCDITMWTKFEEEKNELDSTHENKKVLPGVIIPSDIKITTNMKECVLDKELIIIVVPAAFVDNISMELKKYISDNQHICIATKGIEQDTCLFVKDVVDKYITTDKIAVISGPSFAVDIASGMPIGLSLATKNKETDKVIKKALCNSHMKLRSTDDIIGTEICGSIKNVIAIASGILDGLGANESTKAMFITESLHDIKELIKALDGNDRTVLSFAGFGDLLLTCTSTKSRNFSFGRLVGLGTPKDELDEYIKTHTIEGLYTLKSIYKLINNRNVNIPIIDLIYNIIFSDTNEKELLTFLIEKD